MSKIYVVTQGSYSEYHIIAVFDDIQLAEKCKELYPDGEIEEYELNEYRRHGVPNGMFAWWIKAQRDGRIEVHKTEPDPTYGRFYYEQIDGHLEWVLKGTVHARDEEHAVKITNDKRVALIAANRWPLEHPEVGRWEIYSIDPIDIEDW